MSNNNRTVIANIHSVGFLLILLLSQCTSSDVKENEQVLASINDMSVTATHFENAFKEYYYRTGQVLNQDFDTKKAILDSEFNKYVLVTLAEELGLDQTEQAINRYSLISQKILLEEYIDKAVVGDVSISEEEIRDYYIRFNTRLRAAHIYAESKEEILGYYNRIESGETFDQIAKEAFQNEYLANNAGDIGWFTTDELDISFEEKAFSLQIDEISEPVKTSQGYSIIKLIDRKTTPALTEYDLNAKRVQLESYVRKKKKELIQREHLYAFNDALIFNEPILNELSEQLINGNLISSNDYRSSELVNENVAKFQEFEFSINDLSNALRVSLPQNLALIRNREALKVFIAGVFYRNIFVEKAIEEGLNEQFLVKRTIEETYYSYLVGEAEQYLKNSIKNTPAELYREFGINKDLYTKPLQLNLARIVLPTQKEAETIFNKLEAGADFSKLVKENTIKNEDRFVDGELGYESIKSYGFIAPKLADLQVGEISSVINYQTGEYHIYRCLGRIEPREMMFDEAKSQVNISLTNKKYKALRLETIEEVKERYNAKIDLEKMNEITVKI